jgi:cold-inducible RNA-binding protein
MTESNKIFVGGLAWATDDHGLKAAFESFGGVTEAKVITDRMTGRSRGFGFVTFETSEAASEALSFDGQMLDGRTVRVDKANQRAPR